MTSILAILGSGETAPNMVKVHRELFGHLDSVRAIMLDTPYGFQENIPQLTEKTVTYFSTSLHVDVAPAPFHRFESSSELERTTFLQSVRDANYVFAGPGSPSYALAQWSPLSLGNELRHVLANGVVCFSSAAALTLGAFTAPIYEIYKVGAPLSWLPGLDVLGAVGLRAAIIPHYDNAEGGNHDTRFCYMGATRLDKLEAMLDDDVAIFGVDEHTAAIFDLEADTLSVQGRGGAYWRTRTGVIAVANGTTVPLSELRNAPLDPLPIQPVVQESRELSPAELGELVAAGTADSLDALARLVALATTGGPGRVDPTPLVDAVLEARAAARKAGQYELSDQLRDAVTSLGIEVSDSPAGATWRFRDDN